jgi:segregation and condensation protein B
VSDGERPGLTPDALVEALLFVADGPVEVQRLQRALGLDRAAVDAALTALGEWYIGRGVRLQRTGDSVALASAPEAAEQIERFLGLSDGSRLSAATMETLAIVAYRQPVTRAQIEAIRGVNADHALRALMARNLIAEVGRLDTVGRPAVFGTTLEFLRYFGLESLAQLPVLPEGLAELAAARAAAAREGEH